MRRGNILALVGIGTLAGGLAAAVALLLPWFPDVASKERARIDFVFWFTIWICVVIFALVAAVLLYAVWRFRAAPDDDSDGPPIHGHTGLEILWTAIPTVLVTAIGIVSAVVLAKDDAAGSNPLQVDVFAQQFAWTFSYPQYGNKKSAVLRLPNHRSVVLTMTSKDVIHSFWVPSFIFKRDILPGVKSGEDFEITPTKTGTYEGRCAELCGVDHGRMLFQVKIVPQAEFDQFIASHKPSGGAQ
jgi:cytochrome c oxidase subunit 2